jgi:hypothetical protein
VPWLPTSTPPGLDPRTLQRVRNPMSATDVTTFAADFTGALDSAIDGDIVSSVVSVTFARSDGGTDGFTSVIPPQVAPDGRRVILWLTGGVSGFEYLVSVRINSVAGQNLTRSFVLPVMMR